MKRVEEIKALINDILAPQEGLSFCEEEGVLWGKDTNGHITFAFQTNNTNVLPQTQSTKYIKLAINNLFLVTTQGHSDERNLSALTLVSDDEAHIDLFIRLTLAFCRDLDEAKLMSFFIGLKELFSKIGGQSQIQLQGIYGELLFMKYFYDTHSVDVSQYYQSEQKRKFDFSVTEKKKIEVKTTIRQERVHHFLQQQLDIDRYDIRVVSIMLQRDDKGLSLFELLGMCRESFSHNLNLLIELEKITKGASRDDLDNMRFNYEYCISNMKLFDAVRIPRIKEKNKDGIFNVEYDCDLTNLSGITEDEAISWIQS